MSVLGLKINNLDQAASDGRTFSRINPISGEVATEVAAASLEDARQAVGLVLLEAADGKERGARHGAGADDERNVTDAADEGELGGIKRLAAHVVAPPGIVVAEGRADIGVVIARRNADVFGRADGL